MKCRYCAAPLGLILVDLGTSPPSNAILTMETMRRPEKWIPLRVLVCERCWLVQTEDFTCAYELFDADYSYFSAFSTSWLAHCERYVDDMIGRFGLGSESHVVEVAANDGYLLQYIKRRSIPCTGIEPTAATAAAARDRGIPIVEEFFGVRLAKELVRQNKQADLMVANNVLAHVPDINDFSAGFSILLKPNGVVTFEFPHLMRLVSENQFDTIYHEHFSYLSLITVSRIFSAAGLNIFDVEEHSTHGGSLRVYAQRADTGIRQCTERVDELIQREAEVGVQRTGYYTGFQVRADKVKNDFLAFLLQAKQEGRCVAAYGAAAKGNTLLNYAGVRSDLIPFVVDRNPSKQGKYLPGSRIPIVAEDRLIEEKPDFIVLLPWNLRDEIMEQLHFVRQWGARFVTAVPNLELL